MGYESRIYIVNRFDGWRGSSGEVIAEFELCCMGYDTKEFYDAFTKEIDFDLYINRFSDDDPVKTDYYGESIKYGTLSDLRDALVKSEQKEHYRRIPPLIALLDSFIANSNSWDELIAVRFAH